MEIPDKSLESNEAQCPSKWYWIIQELKILFFKTRFPLFLNIYIFFFFFCEVVYKYPLLFRTESPEKAAPGPLVQRVNYADSGEEVFFFWQKLKDLRNSLSS